MEKSKDQRRLAKPASYQLWAGAFWLLVFLVAGGFYYATQKIAYTWRWNRVPIYFAYKNTVEIISEKGGSCRLEDPFRDAGYGVDGIAQDAIIEDGNDLVIGTTPGQKITFTRKSG